MNVTDVRIRDVIDWKDESLWAAALSAPSTFQSSRVLKEDGAAWVRQARALSRDVVVKCRPLNTLRRRWLSWSGQSHGHRQWKGAESLRKAGLPTARPLALATARVNDAPCELLVIEHLAGPTALEVLADIARGNGPPAHEQLAFARTVAGTVSAFAKAKRCNGDHKPSNLIVLDGDFASPRIATIDCVDIRRYGLVDNGELEDMAVDLLLEPIGCGVWPRRSVWFAGLLGLLGEWPRTPRADRKKILREWIDLLSDRVASHGDPRPRVNPLSAYEARPRA